MTFSGTACRLALVLGSAAAALASSSSNANRPPAAMPQGGAAEEPPPPEPMESSRSHGLWKSNFGPVKIEADPAAGPNAVRGVWVYDRKGEEVIGSFSGALDGNVLRLSWQEPARPADLIGEGYLVFDASGQSFNGRWWSTAGDRRSGDWQGWRQGSEPPGSGPPQEGERPAGPDQPPGDGPAEQGPPPDPSPGDAI